MRFLNINTGDYKTIDIPENATEYQIQELLVRDYCDPDEWLQIPDDGNDYIPDDTTPEGYKEKPVDLNILKQQKIIEVENAYTNSFLNGLESSVGIKFHIKPDDQLNYIGAMIATASLQDTDTLPFPLIDFYGATHQITVGQSRQAYLEIVNYKAQTELQRATLLAQIANAQLLEEFPIIPEVLNNA